MLYTKQDKGIFLGSLIIVFMVAWYLQASLFLNWDVAWLLHATELALQGKTYSNDFFSPNPPIVMFLYMPPVLISKWSGFSIIPVFRLYIFLLAAISLRLCSIFVWKLFKAEDNFLGGMFLVTLASLYLALTIGQLGQRDCLLLVFILPYVLSIPYQVEGNKLSTKLAAGIGLFAGCGLAMKPQFLTVPLLLELYYMFATRKITIWLRVEIAGIVAVLVLSILLALIFFPDYFSVVMPMVLKDYYTVLAIANVRLLYHPAIIYCYLAIVFYFLQYNKNRYQSLSTVLLVTLVGVLGSFFAQHNLFLHHVLAPLTIAFLLLVLLFGMIVTRRDLETSVDPRLAIMTILFFAAMYRANPLIYILMDTQTNLFFTFFGFIFCWLLIASRTNWSLVRVVLSVSLVIGLGYWMYYVMERSSSYPHTFGITFFTLIAGYGLIAPRKIGLPKNLALALAGVLFFAFPLGLANDIFATYRVYKQQILGPMISFMQTLPPNQSIYSLSNSGNFVSPLFYYSGATLSQRYDCLWMVADLAKRERDYGSQNLLNYIKNNKDENFFVNSIAEDFIARKPTVVFVNVTPNNVLLNGYGLHFSFLKNFNAFGKFAQEWSHYQYVRTMNVRENFLEVYTRKS